MQSASRQALAHVRQFAVAALDDAGGTTALTSRAEELYAVADLLARNPRLRRTLADPASAAPRRVELVTDLLGSQVRPVTRDIVAEAVRQRWSSTWDLPDTLEIAGDDALLAAAEADGALDRVEDQLFRFVRILGTEGEVVGLLDEAAVPAPRRLGLLDDLVKGKVAPVTLALLQHAVASERKASILLAVDDLLDEAARRRERSLARVLTAVALTDAQTDRLAEALTEIYHRPISVRADVDPTLRGGLLIRVGDEVIDGSVAHRLAALRETFSG